MTNFALIAALCITKLDAHPYQQKAPNYFTSLHSNVVIVLTLDLPYVLTNLGRTGFGYSAYFRWNELPTALKLNSLSPLGVFLS